MAIWYCRVYQIGISFIAYYAMEPVERKLDNLDWAKKEEWNLRMEGRLSQRDQSEVSENIKTRMKEQENKHAVLQFCRAFDW